MSTKKKCPCNPDLAVSRVLDWIFLCSALMSPSAKKFYLLNWHFLSSVTVTTCRILSIRSFATAVCTSVLSVKVCRSSFFHCPVLHPPPRPSQAGLLLSSASFRVAQVIPGVSCQHSFCFFRLFLCCWWMRTWIGLFQNDHAHIYLELSLEMFYTGLMENWTS